MKWAKWVCLVEKQTKSLHGLIQCVLGQKSPRYYVRKCHLQSWRVYILSTRCMTIPACLFSDWSGYRFIAVNKNKQKQDIHSKNEDTSLQVNQVSRFKRHLLFTLPSLHGRSIMLRETVGANKIGCRKWETKRSWWLDGKYTHANIH